MPKTKVAVLASSKERFEETEEMFDAARYSLGWIPPEQDYFERFKEAERSGAVATIVLGPGLPDIDLAENAMTRYSCKPPEGCGEMRFIFVAPQSFEASDSMIERLMSVGIYDIVVPSLVKERSRDLIVGMVDHPQRFYQVAMMSWKVAFSIYDPRRAPSAIGSQPTSEVAARLSMAGGRQRIAVAGCSARCGTSTAAMAIAKSLLLAGFTVSLVVADEYDFSALRGYYHSAFGDDRSFRICPPTGEGGPVGGIDVFLGKTIGDTHKESQFYVFDYGHVDMRPRKGAPATDAERRQEVLRDEWSSAETQVLVSSTGPSDIAMLNSVIMECDSKRELGKWSLLLNLASESTKRIIEAGVRPYVPGLGAFIMHETPDPLELAEIPGWVADVIEHSTGGLKIEERKGGGAR